MIKMNACSLTPTVFARSYLPLVLITGRQTSVSADPLLCHSPTDMPYVAEPPPRSFTMVFLFHHYEIILKIKIKKYKHYCTMIQLAIQLFTS